MENDSGKDKIKNCFSVDVEGFVESNLQSFHIENRYVSKAKENYEIEKNVNYILNLLDDLNIRGTFFFLGRVAQDVSHVVKETALLEHEIACHSFEHFRIFGLTRREFRNSLIHAKKILEDLTGKGVYGFRAPDFSITKSSIWALDILKEIGFLYDSSIYPTGLHDVYGIKGVKPFIHRLPNSLIEFPLSTVEVFNVPVPFSGGGYFRFYPLIVTKYLIWKNNKLGNPCMFYIHPYEVGTIIPSIMKLSFYRKFRHYYNCKNGGKRLKELLQMFRFGTAIEILQDWDNKTFVRSKV